MAENKKLSPEFIAFISGITKFIDETDAKKAGESKKKAGAPADDVSLTMDTEE